MNLQTPRGRLGTIAASFIVFFAAFVLLYPRFGLSISFLGIIPIFMGAWFYGIWAGSLLTCMLYGVDIDHFKRFNDNYGHVIGDQVLRAVAQMMRSAMRKSDIIGRYGGEEFSIILPDTTNSTAVNMAERLISQVSDTSIETEAGKLAIKLSIGIAGMTKDIPTLHSLIVRADQAMYIAKSAGRNCVAVK